MVEFRRWLSVGVMLGAALQASAAVPPLAENRTAAAASPAAHLMVFGVPQPASSSSVAVTPGKLDGTLTAVAQSYPGIASSDHPIRNLHALNPAARFRLSAPTTTPEVLVDVIAKGDPQALKAALTNLGMRNIAVFSNDVGGWLPVSQLANASALAEMHFARAAMPRTRSSAVATQGDFATMSALTRTNYPGLDGNGVTVGVLSSSFNCFAQYAGSTVPASGYNGYAPFGFTATYQDDVVPSSGQPLTTAAMPQSVTLLEEADCMQYGAPEQLPFTDEGRAIMQIVHAVAPAANLAFHTAVDSEADFATGIQQLAASPVNAKVIDDDVGYPDEPFFQDGLIAQAVNTVAAQGVTYFSSAANEGTNSYENTTPVFSIAGTGSQSNEKLLNFDASGQTASVTLPLSIPKLAPGEFIFLIVQWDQPFVTGAPKSGGATGSLDICVQGNTADVVTDNNSFPNSVTCTGGSTVGQDPVQMLIIGSPASATALTAAESVTITIGLVNGTVAPGRVKFVLGDDGAGATINSQFATNSPTLQGHPGAAGAAAVGAAFYFNTPQCGATSPTLEAFSSTGGDPILFDVTGTRLATPVVRNKPDFVGPDGVNNTMLGAPLSDEADTTLVNAVNATSISGCKDNESFPSFSGTSAAAPHAAGAAALMLQASPNMTPATVIANLQNTAVAMNNPGNTTYNFAAGHGFLDINAAFALFPVQVVSATVSPSVVIPGQTSTLTWTGSNVSGCTASGGWSGAQANSGSQSVTAGAVGTQTYTLSCTGTNGTVTSTANLIVVDQSSSGSGGSGSSGSGSGSSGSTGTTGTTGTTTATTNPHNPFGGAKHSGALDFSTLLTLGGVLLTGRGLRRRLPV